MKSFEETVSENISELRKQRKLTQSELGAKLNYSDKSVSKWERGESLPDLIVLKHMADVLGVPPEYFFHDNSAEGKKKQRSTKYVKDNIVAVSMLGVCFVWLVATICYVYTAGIFVESEVERPWIFFVWAVPVSALVLFISSSKYFEHKYDVYCSSAFIWTLLTALYLQFFGYHIWIIFFIGVPVQVAVILLHMIRKRM